MKDVWQSFKTIKFLKYHSSFIFFWAPTLPFYLNDRSKNVIKYFRLQIPIVIINRMRPWLLTLLFDPIFKVKIPHFNIQFVILLRMWLWPRPLSLEVILVLLLQKSVVKVRRSFAFGATVGRKCVVVVYLQVSLAFAATGS